MFRVHGNAVALFEKGRTQFAKYFDMFSQKELGSADYTQIVSYGHIIRVYRGFDIGGMTKLPTKVVYF